MKNQARRLGGADSERKNLGFLSKITTRGNVELCDHYLHYRSPIRFSYYTITYTDSYRQELPLYVLSSSMKTTFSVCWYILNIFSTRWNHTTFLCCLPCIYLILLVLSSYFTSSAAKATNRNWVKLLWNQLFRYILVARTR